MKLKSYLLTFYLSFITALLRNAIRHAEAMPTADLRVFYSDFTFKLVTEGWPLGLFGCHSLHRNVEKGGENVLQFRHFACCIGPTEKFEVYECLFYQGVFVSVRKIFPRRCFYVW